jgi:hypothetical protein
MSAPSEARPRTVAINDLAELPLLADCRRFRLGRIYTPWLVMIIRQSADEISHPFITKSRQEVA